MPINIQSSGKYSCQTLVSVREIQETIDNIFNELDLAGNPQLPKAKSHLRTDKRRYQELLNFKQKTKIERIFAQEIEWGKYRF